MDEPAKTTGALEFQGTNQTTSPRRCGYCEGTGHLRSRNRLQAGLVLCPMCGATGSAPEREIAVLPPQSKRPCRYPDCRCVASDGEGSCEATGEAIDALFDQGKPWSGKSHDRRQDDE